MGERYLKVVQPIDSCFSCSLLTPVFPAHHTSTILYRISRLKRPEQHAAEIEEGPRLYVSGEEESINSTAQAVDVCIYIQYMFPTHHPVVGLIVTLAINDILDVLEKHGAKLRQKG